MNLKEVRSLQARLKKDLMELRRQRENVSVVEMLPTEDFHDYINDTPETLSDRIEITIEKLLAVENCIRIANTAHREIPDYPELHSIGELAAKPKREKSSSSFRSTSDNTVRVTTINHDLAVEKSNQLTLQCEKMSLLIEKIDMETEVDCNIE